MKVSDYIVEFLIQQKITDVFGYPGGMITHLMESFDHYSSKITAHLNYHEQACAMAACAWAEITGLPGVAYATSGPGATNLLTGIACAYFESLPCIFMTGQVNTYEQKDQMRVRQRGFQETDIVSMATPVTKAAYMVKTASQIPLLLERAYNTAMSGRKGPVLLDIPMDVLRSEIAESPVPLETSEIPSPEYAATLAMDILAEIKTAKRPVILAGHGLAVSQKTDLFRKFVALTGIPVVTSMIAVDVIPSDSPSCFGMIGAYGLRWANYLVDYSDCILTLGSRLDCRQTGVDKSLFATQSKILRVDIDPGELDNRIGKREIQFVISLQELLPALVKQAEGFDWNFTSWSARGCILREKIQALESKNPGNLAVEKISQLLPDHITITTDVGQNQVWIAQSLRVKAGQRVLFSGGHGAMGYSLPAAIGAAVATKRPVVCFVGDGGLQMNLQELQFVVREKLPIKIILLNNRSLGMIHHFQEMYFNGNYVQTDDKKGFTVPDFCGIARAYGLRVISSTSDAQLAAILCDNLPVFLELELPQTTHVFPKLGMNSPLHEQEPPLSEEQAHEMERICLGYEEN